MFHILLSYDAYTTSLEFANEEAQLENDVLPGPMYHHTAFVALDYIIWRHQHYCVVHRRVILEFLDDRPALTRLLVQDDYLKALVLKKSGHCFFEFAIVSMREKHFTGIRMMNQFGGWRGFLANVFHGEIIGVLTIGPRVLDFANHGFQ